MKSYSRVAAMKQVVFLSQTPEQSLVGKNSTFYHSKSLA